VDLLVFLKAFYCLTFKLVNIIIADLTVNCEVGERLRLAAGTMLMKLWPRHPGFTAGFNNKAFNGFCGRKRDSV
jgi:hypothetical protein